MRNIVLYIAISLDGYIARQDGSLDWLPQPAEGDMGYSEFYNTIDTVVMGRTTYEQIINELSPDVWPYEGRTCYVATTKHMEDTKNVSFINGDIADYINSLKNQQGKDIWLVGGGKLIADFVSENLIDKYTITITPTIIGSGIPLFQKDHSDVNLKLVNTKTYGDIVELTYCKK